MNESAAAWLCVLPLISLVIMIFAVMQLILAQRAHDQRAAEAGLSAPRPNGHHENTRKSLTKKDGPHLARVTVWTEDTSSNSECAVCLEQFSKGKLVRVLRCKHAFHVKCIECWFSFKGCNGDNVCNEWQKRCPLCMAACVSERSMRSLPDETAAASSDLPPSDIESATGSLSTSLRPAREQVMDPGRQWMGRVDDSVDSVHPLHQSVQIGSPVPNPPGTTCVPGAVVCRGLTV